MRPARVLAATATTIAWLPPLVFGIWWPEYSAIGDFVSELGALGAPHAAWVNASFALAGALFVATCLALARSRPEWRLPLALLSAVGVSYLVASLVPCDQGCPAAGSGQQALHNAAGAAGYLLGGLGLLRLGGALAAGGRPGAATLVRAAGVVAIGGLVAMGAPELEPVRGAIQRLVEAGVFASLLVASR